MRLNNLIIKSFARLSILLCGAAACAAACAPAVNAQTARIGRGSGDGIEIKLYFVPEDWNYDNLVAVVRRIPKKPRGGVANAALRELFKGASDAERKRGLLSAYSVESSMTGREGCGHDVIKPLGAYFIGVRIRKGVATVNFRKPAECYLQSAIFTANAVMLPIEATLKQFKSVKEVRFALDGEVITEWDV